MSWMIAEVEMDAEPELGFRRDSTGTHAIGPTAEEGRVRVVLTRAGRRPPTGDPTMSELRAALITVYGTDYGGAQPDVGSRGSPT